MHLRNTAAVEAAQSFLLKVLNIETSKVNHIESSQLRRVKLQTIDQSVCCTVQDIHNGHMHNCQCISRAARSYAGLCTLLC